MLLRLLTFGLLLAGLVAPHAAWADEVRVRLFETVRPEAVDVQPVGAPLLVFLGNSPRPFATLSTSQRLRLSPYGADLCLELPEQTVYALAVRLEPKRGGSLRLRATSPVQDPSEGQYTGRFVADVADRQVRVVNHVPLPDYVASVVTHEYGFDDLEGNKAMAVLARTYALRARKGPEAAYDLVDHVGAQVYRGQDDLHPAAVRATRQTQGETLTYDGAPIEAVYYASSGGHTAANESVWASAPVPYLRAQPDPFDAAAPYGAWTAEVPRRALLRALSQTYGTSVEGFLVGTYSDEGRVQTIQLLGPDQRTISGNAFRQLVNLHFGATRLRSTFWTDVRREGDRYVFEGKGYGHGVGLSQWGAHAMAAHGYAYRDILGFYYPGVALSPGGPLPTLRLAADVQVDPGVVTEPGENTAPPTRPIRQSRGRVGW